MKRTNVAAQLFNNRIFKIKFQINSKCKSAALADRDRDRHRIREHHVRSFEFAEINYKIKPKGARVRVCVSAYTKRCLKDVSIKQCKLQTSCCTCARNRKCNMHG